MNFNHLPPSNRFFSLFLLVLLFTSCLSDNLDDCPTVESFAINLKYDVNVSGSDEISSVVKYVDLYIYDESGILKGSYNYSKSELVQSDYKCVIELPPGQYKFVAWMNRAPIDYSVGGVNLFSTALQSLNKNADGTVTRDSEPVYFGSADATIILGLNNDISISMMRNTKQVLVHSEFDNVLPPTMSVEAYITGTNGVYNFANTSTGTDLYRYIPRYTITYAGQTNHADFTIQRIWSTDDLELSIVRKQPSQPDLILQSIRLTPTIMTNPNYNTNDKLNRNHRFELTFQFTYNPGTGTFVNATILVDDWVVNTQTGGMH